MIRAEETEPDGFRLRQRERGQQIIEFIDGEGDTLLCCHGFGVGAPLREHADVEEVAAAILVQPQANLIGGVLANRGDFDFGSVTQHCAYLPLERP